MGLKSVLFRPTVLNGPASSTGASPGSRDPEAASPNSKQDSGGTETLLAVAEELKTSIQTLYVNYLSPDGTGVDYAGLRASPEFSAYVAATRKLAPLDITALQNLPKADKISFFINVYNALTIHANAIHDLASVPNGQASSGPSPEPNPVPDHPSSSSSSSSSSTSPPTGRGGGRLTASATYMIAGQPFSLSDIEHGVLRGNRAPPSILGTLLGAPFGGAGRRDARRGIALEAPDPRIHFALNCGAVSCPPVRVFQRHNLEWALDAATASFIADDANFRLVPPKRTVWLSRIFKWYMRDFADAQPDPDGGPRGPAKGKRRALMALLWWIVQHGGKDLEKRKTLETWLGEAERGEGKVKVKFLKYDWNRNEM